MTRDDRDVAETVLLIALLNVLLPVALLFGGIWAVSRMLAVLALVMR